MNRIKYVLKYASQPFVLSSPTPWKNKFSNWTDVTKTKKFGHASRSKFSGWPDRRLAKVKLKLSWPLQPYRLCLETNCSHHPGCPVASRTYREVTPFPVNFPINFAVLSVFPGSGPAWQSVSPCSFGPVTYFKRAKWIVPMTDRLLIHYIQEIHSQIPRVVSRILLFVPTAVFS